MNILEQTKNGVPVLYADGIEAAGGAVHGFSTRKGGVSQGIFASLNLGLTRGDDPEHVRENYRRFLSAVGTMDKTTFAMCNQVHGDTVRAITTADVKSDLYGKLHYEADGMMTAIPGVALVVFSADCIPVLLYDPVRRVIAALHSGWRGTAAGIVTRAVERMEEVYGCRPENILAAGEILRQSDRVLCMGQGGSMIMAMEASHLFSTAFPNFIPVYDSHLQTISAATLTQRDAVLFFSYSGSTRELMDILTVVREQKARIILVTHFPKSPAASFADVILQCGANEGPLQLGSVPARLAQLFVVDVLFAEVCRRSEGCQQARERVAAALAAKHI